MAANATQQEDQLAANGSALVAAYRLDGNGGGLDLGWEEIHRWQPGQGTLWIHLDYAQSEAREWLLGQAGLESTVAEALIAKETRPRSLTVQGGLLVILRGANLNSGASPDDMVAIRLWLEAERIISTRNRIVRSIEAIRESIESGNGPTNPGDFLIHVADGLTTRAGAAVADLEDEVDGLEDEVLSAESYELRTKIGAFRRSAIQFRRYLAPQKDTLLHLQSERVQWLDDTDRAHLREIGDRTLRMIEDLDSARDRAAVTQDELNSRLSEQMNKTMYVLSIVAGIFLPLGLLTGLLGINVGGMPGVNSPWAFMIVCVVLAATAALLTILFRHRGWI
jgi:zinc transporter